ncbi:MAG: dTDP-4-dehydrorhamnose 3,5-epimerase [Planctomycetes bacterium]|nr:dTDP-4-dehydrorhamnose 3,5-epimerase [Planctomycetota bacterium]
MPKFIDSEKIKGVQIVVPEAYADDRGVFRESFRREWFPQRAWSEIQFNRSDSKKGVVRGLHFHQHQIDYWFVMNGKIQVGLFDARKDSPTFANVETFVLDADDPRGAYIPVGVAHGFLALTDCIMTYVVDQYFTGRDEYGIKFDDPALAVPWEKMDYIVSGRDKANPLWKDVPPELLDFRG